MEKTAVAYSYREYQRRAMKLCERLSGPSLAIAVRPLLTVVLWLPALISARPLVASAQDAAGANFTCQVRSLAAVPPPAPPSLPPTLRQLAVGSQGYAAPEMKPLCAEGQVPVPIGDPRYFHKGNPLIGPYAARGPEHALPGEFVKSNLLRTFDQVYGKSSSSSAPPRPESTALPPAPACNGVAWFNACYFYANAAEIPTSLDGGGLTLEIVAPLVDGDNASGHSIGEIAVEGTGNAGSTLNDVEMGFSVAPNQWGNNNPHLFVYHFIDGAETCYDTCDWNQYSSTYFPGMDISTLDGQQVYLGWVQYQGAWWAWFNGQWLGYINNSVWTNNFTQTALIQWYGEIAVVDNFPPRSQMGNGQFSAATTAANMSTLCTVNAGIWECDYSDLQSAGATQISYYDILNHTNFGAIRYGGPGETVGTVPTVTVSPSSANITAAQPLTVTVTVAGTTGNLVPTGPINLTSGSYTTFWWYTLANGSVTVPVPAGSLAVGTDTLTVNYAPDITSAWTYDYASATATVSVTAIAPSISFAVADQTYGTAPFTVAATSNSGGAMTYSIVSGPATLSGSTVTLTGTGTVVLQASQVAAGLYTAGTQTTSFTVFPNTSPTITFSVPNHTYGDPPFTVAATSPSSGAITYSVVSGPATVSGSTITLTGAGTVELQASQAAAGSYTAGAQTATFAVATESQTITFAALPSSVNFGVTPIGLSASSTSGLPVAFSVLYGPASVSGSTLTIAGAGTVVVAADQSGNTNYAAAAEVTHLITVNKIAPAAGLTASPNPILIQNVLTLTATVSSSAGTPTGAVVFSDSGTALGTVNLSGGIANLPTSTLTAGAHSLAAAYSGDANFTSVSSTAISETVEDFTLTIGGSGSSQTVQPGGAASYTLPMSPSGGTTFPAAVTFSTSGVPTGFTATFSPTSLAAGSSATNVALTIQVPVTAMLHQQSAPPGRDLPLVALAVLLPFAAGIRKPGNALRFIRMVMIVAGMGGLYMLAGCGGGGGSSGGGGGSQPQTYNITVTATSGTLSHSTTVTITVE